MHAVASRPLHFVSDVHLVCGQPDTWEAFFAYLNGPARESVALYLLGDIFDAWIGDDDNRALAEATRQHLANLVASGVEVNYIIGNHDFLVGKRLAKTTGIRLLGEMAAIEFGGKRILLMHGDTLITSDKAYQEARRKMMRPWFLFYARLLPQNERRRRGELMLGGTDRNGFHTTGTEVDHAEVDRLLAEHRADVMIHGHTHRPGIHALSSGKQRCVLPAWNDENGGWLVADETGLHLNASMYPLAGKDREATASLHTTN